MPKLLQLPLLNHWRLYSPKQFHWKLQVEPEMFDSLVALIIDNLVFSNNSNCSQFPVYLKLYIFLFCVGYYSNAASPKNTAQWAGVSIGGVEKCTDCVVVALLWHYDKAIHFPDADEKEDTKDYIEEQMCSEWHNGFLLADGTKFAFFQCPGLHGNTWFDKDGEYSIDCQVSHDNNQQTVCLLTKIHLACYDATHSHDC